MRKIWVDDIRPAPEGYLWVRSTHEAIVTICQMTMPNGTHNIEILNMDHDAGDYAWNGGDYIQILNWMEEHHIDDIPIKIHTQNPVGRENMRRIIHHNHWKEIY